MEFRSAELDYGQVRVDDVRTRMLGDASAAKARARAPMVSGADEDDVRSDGC